MTVVEQMAGAETATPVTTNRESTSKDPSYRRQEAVVALGRRAMAPADVSILLADAAALSAETLDADSSSVAELIGPDGALQMRLATNDENRGAEIVELPRDRSLSLAGFALQVAHPLHVPDITADERFKDEFLAQCGVRSAVACPLIIGDRLFGTLGVYSKDVNRFAAEDVLFVESVSHVVTATLAREQAEAARDEQAKFAAAVLKTVDAIVVFLDKDGKIADANRMCEQATGFETESIRGRDFTSVFIVPEEADSVAKTLGKLRCGQEIVEIESQVLTKHHDSRRVSWNFSAVRGDDGEVASFVASGSDVTEQRELAEELKIARASLDQAKGGVASDGDVPLPEDDEALYPFRRLPRGPLGDRREKPRRAFPYVQLLAPIYGGKMPSKTSFKQIRCRDIAAGGFSYATREEPDFDKVVVALGTAPALTYLTAEVMHVTRYERDGSIRFILGCRYLGRARY